MSSSPAEADLDSSPAALWLWPITPPARVREQAWEIAGAADRWSRGVGGVAAAVAVGVLPLLLSAAFTLPGHRSLSAFVLILLSLSCVRRDDGLQAVGLALVAFIAHSAAVMLLVNLSPERTARILPGAADYWHKQLDWIRTGWDPEYEPALWLPVHLGQLGAGIVYSYASLGWITFAEGFRQVDWMNYSSAELMRVIRSPALAGLLAWHLWSLVCGVGVGFVVIEALSLSLGRLSGRDHPESAARSLDRRTLPAGPRRPPQCAAAPPCPGGSARQPPLILPFPPRAIPGTYSRRSTSKEC